MSSVINQDTEKTLSDDTLEPGMHIYLKARRNKFGNLHLLFFQKINGSLVNLN